MHRPPARRPRLLTGALIAPALLAACTDDGPAAAPVRTVAVAAQPCDRPLPAEGVGVVLADGTVVTAGHVVEGPRRRVTVDGADATVIAVDPRTDLAVLRAEVAGAAALAAEPAGDVHVSTPDGEIAATIVRSGPLVVHDVTEGARYERAVHTIRPAVPDGTSGAPLVDGAGDVAGIVVLVNRGDGTAYAVTSDEVRQIVAANLATTSDIPVRPAAALCPD